MKLQDKYRDDFLQAKNENKIASYRFQHGKQVYETACIECLERLQKLNVDRLNYMLQKENVCAFILVLGLSKYMKYKDFFEFLSFSYDDGQENNSMGEKNLEMIIKFFISGYDNLVIQKQINLNVEQLQESDEITIIKYYDQVQNEENPIGRMQELVSKHIKENIILGFNDDEILDLSFLGYFRLSSYGASFYSSKKKRKSRLFQLSLPFVLFYIHEQRIFDLNATYSTMLRYNKQLSRQQENNNQSQKISQNQFNEGDYDLNLDELLQQDEQKIKIIKLKMEKSPLFKDLEAKNSSSLNNLKSQQISTKSKKKTILTPAIGGVSSSNQQSNNNTGGQQICSNTGKVPAFISILHQDQQIREPILAAGILPVQQRDPAEIKVIEALVHANDVDKNFQEHEFIQNIMKEPYDYSEDENLVSEDDNPKGLILEMAIKNLKTHSCLQFKCTQIKPKEFECILLFQVNTIYTRGRGISKKACEKIAAAKMIPLLQEYIQQKETQNNKPKKFILFSTHTNQTLKKTDKVNNDLKNHHPQLQKIIENNLYHPTASNGHSGQSSSKNNSEQDSKRNNNPSNANGGRQNNKKKNDNNQNQLINQNYQQQFVQQNSQAAQQLYQQQYQMSQLNNFYIQHYQQKIPTFPISYSSNIQTAQPQQKLIQFTRTQSNQENSSSDNTNTPTTNPNQPNKDQK